MNWRTLWIAACVAAGVTLVSLMESYFIFPREGAPPPAMTLLLYKLPRWLYWALVAPPIFWLSRHWPLRASTLLQRVPVYIGLCILVVGGHMIVASAATVLAFPEETTFAEQVVARAATSHINILFFAALVGIGRALANAQTLKEHTQNELELRSALTEAQLSMLKSQLQPHFLFNTLHSISVLVRKDPTLAIATVTKLGDLLRMALEDRKHQWVSLRRELAFLQVYLDIQQIRFGKRLSVTTRIDDALLNARVPNLLLQPLVENAIKYGLEPHTSDFELTLDISRQDELLRILIIDSGPGMPPDGASAEGFGIGNTRARLEKLCTDCHTFSFENQVEGGLKVTIEVPYHMNDQVHPSKEHHV